MRRFFPTLMLAIITIAAAAAAQNKEPQYPTKDEISSAMNSSEMAVNMYEQDVQTVESMTGQKFDKDHELIRNARTVIQGIRRDPEGRFTSAVALMLVTTLDDADRNDLLNAAQLLGRIGARGSDDVRKSESELHMVQAIQRTDQLLYLASNEVFNLGIKRADADEVLAGQAGTALDQCMQILKKQK